MWFTEQGPIYSGTAGNHNDYTRGDNQLKYLMETLVGLSTRITRFYYYAMHGNYELRKDPASPDDAPTPIIDPVSGQPQNFQHDSGMIDPAKENKDFYGNDPVNPATGQAYTPEEQLRPTYCRYGRMSSPLAFPASVTYPACTQDTNGL